MTARLRILMETVPDTDVVASMLPAFRAEHPDLAVDVEAMHYDDMSGPTLASLRADEPDLDLVILDNSWVDGLVGAGQLEPLDERIAGAPGIHWDGYYPALRSAWADGLDPATYYQPFDTLHAGARPLVVGPNAENVIVAVGEELHPAVAGIIGVDEAVTRAARRAEALLAG